MATCVHLDGPGPDLPYSTTLISQALHPTPRDLAQVTRYVVMDFELSMQKDGESDLWGFTEDK